MEESVRVKSVLKTVLGLCAAVVICGVELATEADRPKLVVSVRQKAGRKGRCGKCGRVSPWFDNGGGERRWRHVDVAYATCDLVAQAPRVSCKKHGPTVAEVAWARHDSWFTRAFEDLVVYDAISSNKNAAARRYGLSWRAVDNMCVRVATEALGRVDLLSGLVAIAIDEVKYKKGHKCLLVSYVESNGCRSPGGTLFAGSSSVLAQFKRVTRIWMLGSLLQAPPCLRYAPQPRT
jgi:transposase